MTQAPGQGPPTEPCPRCGGTAERDETDVGVFIKCLACGFEAAEQLHLDFKSD